MVFSADTRPLAANSQALSAPQGDGRLLVIAFGLSVVLNFVLLAAFAFASISSQEFRKAKAQAELLAQPPPQETSVLIFPEMVQAAPATSAAEPSPAAPATPVTPPKQRFARTSADQAEETPEAAAFIGERNTRATSDRAPTAGAPPLPSQSGIQPRHEGDMETTNSRYQDGELDSSGNSEPSPPTPPSTPATPAEPASPTPPTPPEQDMNRQDEDAESSTPPPLQRLLEGPNPVDTPVPAPPETPEKDAEVKPEPPQQARTVESTPPPLPATPPTPRPSPVSRENDPAFRGNQTKTAITGSISRNGVSAMDVVDSPLGRYQAAVSRVIELEWQRNCVKHRDFITPGFLTVRFFVEPSGRVRSVKFVGEMQTGEVQKGFTLNSIRNAKLPVMPPAVRKDYQESPLELIYNFYF